MRHRQQQFASPFEIPEMEWKPRRDRIFVPSGFRSGSTIVIPEIDWKTIAIDWAKEEETWAKKIEESNERFRRQLFAHINDCSPARSEYLGIPRGDYNPTYANIERSTEPQFRSRRGSWGRDW